MRVLEELLLLVNRNSRTRYGRVDDGQQTTVLRIPVILPCLASVTGSLLPGWLWLERKVD